MLHNILIERRARRHHHRRRRALPPPRASGALPARSDRARVPRHHHRIQRSDVDPQFQRVRGHQRADLAIAQAALDFAALARQISAAIPAHGLARHGPFIAGILQVRDQHLGGQAAVGEHQRLQVVFDELQRHAPGFGNVAAPDAELPVHHRRIVEDEELFAVRRAVVFHQREGFAGQRFGQLARVRNGGRTADELRFRVIELANAS